MLEICWSFAGDLLRIYWSWLEICIKNEMGSIFFQVWSVLAHHFLLRIKIIRPLQPHFTLTLHAPGLPPNGPLRCKSPANSRKLPANIQQNSSQSPACGHVRISSKSPANLQPLPPANLQPIFSQSPANLQPISGKNEASFQPISIQTSCFENEFLRFLTFQKLTLRNKLFMRFKNKC